MLNFDFIRDFEFKRSLESDSQELTSVLKEKAWKSVLVLAGSIVEAILVDYLIALKPQDKKAYFKKELGKIIDECYNEKIISEKTYKLSEVIRYYRNLIHPGKAKRLKEKPSEESAEIAHAVLKLILKEISTKRKDEFGLTAVQLLSKVVTDPSVMSIFRELIKSTEEEELKKLMIKIIPDFYFEKLRERDPKNENTLENLEICFHLAFDAVAEENKALVAKKFIEILRTGTQEVVFAYETAFFRCKYLEYLTEDERNLTKKHVIARLAKHISKEVITTLYGIEVYASKDELIDLTYHLIYDAIFSKSDDYKSKVKTFLKHIYLYFDENSKERGIIENLFKKYKKHYEKHGKDKIAHSIDKIKDEIISALPF